MCFVHPCAPFLSSCGVLTPSSVCTNQVTANNQLFNVVVDNDEIAARLVKHLEDTRGGRVTFMPLNRTKPPRVTYPEDAARAIPLINKLEFAAVHAPVRTDVGCCHNPVVCRRNAC